MRWRSLVWFSLPLCLPSTTTKLLISIPPVNLHSSGRSRRLSEAFSFFYKALLVLEPQKTAKNLSHSSFTPAVFGFIVFCWRRDQIYLLLSACVSRCLCLFACAFPFYISNFMRDLRNIYIKDIRSNQWSCCVRRRRLRRASLKITGSVNHLRTTDDTTPLFRLLQDRDPHSGMTFLRRYSSQYY